MVGAVLLLAAIAYYILQTLIIPDQGGHELKLARASALQRLENFGFNVRSKNPSCILFH